MKNENNWLICPFCNEAAETFDCMDTEDRYVFLKACRCTKCHKLFYIREEDQIKRIRMKIGNLVRVKKTGQEGNIRILEGIPPYKAYVDMIPGAVTGYVYFSMYIAAEEQYIKGTPSGVDMLALNPYDIDELEIVNS